MKHKWVVCTAVFLCLLVSGPIPVEYEFKNLFLDSVWAACNEGEPDCGGGGSGGGCPGTILGRVCGETYTRYCPPIIDGSGNVVCGGRWIINCRVTDTREVCYGDEGYCGGACG